MKKFIQHYVWRSYLKPWSVGEKIWCLRDGKTYNTNLKNVASERLFYELPDLTPEDLDFIEKVAIEQSPETLKQGHREFLDNYTQPWKLRKLIETVEDFDPAIKVMVDYQQLLPN